jgi:1-acyl-sn-glycerol-3-phosphate acyltransferase
MVEPAAPPAPEASPQPLQGPVSWTLGQVRLVLRLSALVSTTSGLFAYYVALRPLVPKRRFTAWRNRTIQIWARTALQCLGGRVRAEGLPPGGCLVVSNHLSYVDIPVLASLFPSIFVSKAEVKGWPLMGTVAGAAGTIFVDRERKRDLPEVAQWIGRELAAGSSVVLFPEGTSSPGAELLPFRPSLLAPASSAGLPVAYAAITYRSPEGHPPASESICWWGGMTFGGHILGLLRLPRFEVEVRFGPDTLQDPDRKVLADRLWHAVHTIFKPTT